MIEFKTSEITAQFLDASGNRIERVQQIRIDPVSQKKCRITPSRSLENERGTERLYDPPAADLDEKKCPFCPGNLETMTPCLDPKISEDRRLSYNQSILFPNLFPYTEWSAVSLFDNTHHVEIGTAGLKSYQDSFINCSQYLFRVKSVDPSAIYMSITQNHLPGAGGSLVHPHLQVHATRQISNNHKILEQQAKAYRDQNNGCIFSDLLSAEKSKKERYIGKTGAWEWVAAFAPSGFYEVWGISTACHSLLDSKDKTLWQDLARGVLNTQKFYKSLNRNAYNLALMSIEDGNTASCLKVSITARSSYAPWVRSDFTGFEIASGEMATFTYPESVAAKAGQFWK
ncbi:MAG: galactose-1-phosphate uridylyltransferase [Desulfobacteraceae bacterium]|nr:galactose-1-phosphate uridylyltransferase [Desulfobacteraceae bacterium]